jgi:outer membrane protein
MVESFSNQIGNNKNQQVGLQLSIPVFNGFKNSRAISAAKIDIEKSNLKLEQERLLSEQQLEIESKNKVNYLIVEEKLAQVLQFARDSFKTTQAKFTSGTADAFSFASAKNNLLTSEYALLKSKLQSQFTLFKINLIQKNDL